MTLWTPGLNLALQVQDGHRQLEQAEGKQAGGVMHPLRHNQGPFLRLLPPNMMSS